MRGRLECRACGHQWVGALDDDDTERRTARTRCCTRCHVWKAASIVERLPAPPPPSEPTVCAVDGCITRLHSLAVKEGRVRCYVHEREATEAELEAEAELFALGIPAPNRRPAPPLDGVEDALALLRWLASRPEGATRRAYDEARGELPAPRTLEDRFGRWSQVVDAALDGEAA